MHGHRAFKQISGTTPESILIHTTETFKLSHHGDHMMPWSIASHANSLPYGCLLIQEFKHQPLQVVEHCNQMMHQTTVCLYSIYIIYCIHVDVHTVPWALRAFTVLKPASYKIDCAPAHCACARAQHGQSQQHTCTAVCACGSSFQAAGLPGENKASCTSKTQCSRD